MTEEERQKLKLYCFNRQIAAFQIYGEKLIEEIKEAFAENEYPGDENLVVSAAHRAECEECREIYEFFVGKSWQDCLAEEFSRKACGGESLLNAAAWHYYLPSRLIQTIKRRQFYSWDFEEKIDEDIPEITKWQKERITLLTSKQCKVIIDYLEIALQVWQGIEKGYQDDTKPLMFWQRNYQKALDKERNLEK